MEHVAVLVSVLAVLAASPAGTPSDPLLEEAKSAVKEQLKDPDSAQFRNLAITKNTLGETAVCGEYNARNSYGGYVGFKSFGVVRKAVATDLAELERMGCSGTDAERTRREMDARAALTDKFKAEADFNCNVIWTLLDNHFRDGHSAEAVLGAAMVATANRARENGHEIVPEVLQMIRSQYETSLAKTATDETAIKSIQRGDGIFKLQFITSCTLATVQALQVQAGVK